MIGEKNPVGEQKRLQPQADLVTVKTSLWNCSTAKGEATNKGTIGGIFR
jgi:hypothetical protein